MTTRKPYRNIAQVSFADVAKAFCNKLPLLRLLPDYAHQMAVIEI